MKADDILGHANGRCMILDEVAEMPQSNLLMTLMLCYVDAS